VVEMKRGEKNILMGLAVFTPLVMVACFMVFSPYNEVLILSSAIKAIFTLAFLCCSLLFICRLYRLCRDDSHNTWDRVLQAAVYLLVAFVNPVFILWINWVVNMAVNDIVVMA
jgi:Mn2+/Fe2+ NRAMP family transporter